MVVVALAFVSVGSACGGDDSPTIDASDGGTTTSTTVTGAAGGSAGSETADTGEPYGTAAVSVAGKERGLLTAVRAAPHAGFVRIVFEFRDALPGYAVDYTKRPIVQDGSGAEVALAGDEALLVRFEPASGYDLEADDPGPTYTGPKRLLVADRHAPEVVEVGDFEAVLQWAIGMDERLPFRVTTLSGPSRLVVDVSTSSASR